jgi:hypothetical protein
MEYVRDVVAEESLMEAFVLTDQDNGAAVRLYRSTGGQVEGGTSVLFIYPGQRNLTPFSCPTASAASAKPPSSETNQMGPASTL